MAVHTIMLPDRMRGREPRSIVWDDEAGTVTGEHSGVPLMQKILAAPTPVDCSDVGLVLFLLDPAHDPADFWWLLYGAYWPVVEEPLRSTLPAVFRNTEPRPGKSPAKWHPDVIF